MGALAACGTVRVARGRAEPASSVPAPGAPRAPYAQSRFIGSVTWDFSTVTTHRQAHGSYLWPCAWARDHELYCAWGDGGGFDGDADDVGRASLGFARVTGQPDVNDPTAIRGKNVWGALPYAENPATFGGKVGSMISVNGILYAHGGFWTRANASDPIHKGGRGPLLTVAWSSDLARSWHLADWSSTAPLGGFLDSGEDAIPSPAWVFLYFQKTGDDRNVYLARTAPSKLMEDPAKSGNREYFAGLSWWRFGPHWSLNPADAVPVFSDPNRVEGSCVTFDRAIGRYLLTAGHYVSGNDDDSSAGQVGLFEARAPWGPWRTVGYYEDWGGDALDRETRGDFLGLRLPSKWISADGKTLWAVFSGLKSFDSFNVVRAELSLH